MNRLSLALFVRRKCGISGSNNTTINAIGEWSDVVAAVDEAYENIQTSRPDWLFLRTAFSFVTVTQQGDYPYASAPLSLTDFASWIDDEFTIYKTAVTNEQHLSHWKDYEQFRRVWLFGSQRTQYSQPANIVISPTKSLTLGPAPEDASYTVQGFYQKIPDVMTADADIPIFPVRFHKIIAYEAIKLLGVGEVAAELIDSGEYKRNELQAALEADQLPPITFI